MCGLILIVSTLVCLRLFFFFGSKLVKDNWDVKTVMWENHAFIHVDGQKSDVTKSTQSDQYSFLDKLYAADIKDNSLPDDLKWTLKVKNRFFLFVPIKFSCASVQFKRGLLPLFDILYSFRCVCKRTSKSRNRLRVYVSEIYTDKVPDQTARAVWSGTLSVYISETSSLLAQTNTK